MDLSTTSLRVFGEVEEIFPWQWFVVMDGVTEEENGKWHELCKFFNIVLEIGNYPDGIVDIIVGFSAIIGFNLDRTGTLLG
jgi:hypothetical protein